MHPCPRAGTVERTASIAGSTKNSFSRIDRGLGKVKVYSVAPGGYGIQIPQIPVPLAAKELGIGRARHRVRARDKYPATRIAVGLPNPSRPIGVNPVHRHHANRTQLTRG